MSAATDHELSGTEPRTPSPNTTTTKGITMSTQTTDPSTAWLGEYADALTAKQIDKLNFFRSSMQPGPGFSEDVDGVLLSDAAEEVEHNRLQHRLAQIPLPDWATDTADGWMLDNDGATRRGHTLLSFPTIQCTVPSAMSGSYASVYAGGEEVVGSAPDFFVSIDAHGASLDAEQARQLATQLLDAADKLEEVQAGATVPA